MLDHTAALLALRARALTLVVCTTGSTTLSATSTGYARSSGSFVADGFRVGMEVTGAGFSTSGNNGAAEGQRVITAVSALAITCAGTTTESAGSGKTLSVGLPAQRAWENVALTPVAGRGFLEEEYLPGPAAQVTLGARGQVEVFPTYVLKLYGLADRGAAALYASADALLALYPPRYPLTLSTGDVLTVRTAPAPYRSQLQSVGSGWSLVVLTIPCRARSANSY